ncbi:MAG: hypothetical protein U0Q15_08250 [Kineosporiaceae bacterium]
MSELWQLRARWEATATAAGAGPREAVEACGERLLAAWGDPGRGYHDVRHLAEVLDRADDLDAQARDGVAVRLALWFHDAVYRGAPDDEEASAVLAEHELSALGVPAPLVAEVARLVRLTASHDPAPGDPDGCVVTDCDLAILAAPPQRYADYVAGVRRDWAHVDDAAFAAGRSAVLRDLLGREHLFRTAAGAARWDAAARANLRSELGAG